MRATQALLSRIPGELEWQPLCEVMGIEGAYFWNLK